VQDPEVIADAEALDLVFNQTLRRLEQALLHFADADSQSAGDSQTFLDEKLAKEI
jgi:hypothetical protein